ncbi:MAG TPA: Flp pilus assembly protein CpaB [Pirellulales bacterium]|nr:Flp pilus assembly protein CpaB [Pirellulales bacterium]
MRPKSLMLLIVALGCGLVAAVGINQMMAARDVTAAPTGETVPVFLAKEPINLGDTVKPDMVKLEEFPTDKLPPGAVTSLEDLKGRRARQKILPGMPIVDAWLLGKGESGDDVTTLVPKGYRIAPVRVDAVSGVAGLIKPGDRVDVLVHVRENPSMGINKTSTQTFLQNVKVFAVDDIFRRDSDGQTSVAAKTISLVVTPGQAELVTLATEMGTVRLVMRNSDDELVADTSGATPRQLFGLSDDTPPMEPNIEKEPSSGLMNLIESQRTQADPPAPPKDHWKMLVFDGAAPRQVEFEDGVPLDMVAPTGGIPAGSVPAPDTQPADSSSDSPPADGGEPAPGP